MRKSKYQKQILDWVKNGNGNATCGAVAGSGKTTTIKLAALELAKMGISPDEIKIVVFNKQNSLEMIEKFGKKWKYSIQTLHSVGFQLIQKEVGRFSYNQRIANNKYKEIAEQKRLIPKTFRDRKVSGTLTEQKAIERPDHFLNLVDLARLTLSDLSIESLSDIIAHHNLEGILNIEIVAEAVQSLLLEGEMLAIEQHIIDFTDMIYLPVKWQLNERPWFKTYQFLMIDECQDLNAAQLGLSLMLAGKNGRILSVGDENQAIYGFSGADSQSYQKIIERTQAIKLPLSLCYRCPKSHIDLVNKFFPDILIEADKKAPEGILKGVLENELWSESSDSKLKFGDMVISRKTAPLVGLCIRLIAKGIAATVKGRDIGKQIKNEVEAISKLHLFEYSRFNYFLQYYRTAKFKAYSESDNEEALKENLTDKLNAISTIHQSNPQLTSANQLCEAIDNLFSDGESPITLCTCHRAKGLEGERIFIIKPLDLPLSWKNQKDWQRRQEFNLLYVALTRSTSELYIVADSQQAFPVWFKPAVVEEEEELKLELALVK